MMHCEEKGYVALKVNNLINFDYLHIYLRQLVIGMTRFHRLLYVKWTRYLDTTFRFHGLVYVKWTRYLDSTFRFRNMDFHKFAIVWELLNYWSYQLVIDIKRFYVKSTRVVGSRLGFRIRFLDPEHGFPFIFSNAVNYYLIYEGEKGTLWHGRGMCLPNAL